MTDQAGRTGYIAANDQFQFDKPPQAGAIYTAGWSVCSNGSIALGGSAIFYQCLSGSFYNLYDTSQGGQCAPIYIDVIGAAASSAPAGTATVTSVAQVSDGQPQATSVVVTQISDGQPQAITQISDGQPQAPQPCPASQIADGQPQACTASAAPVSQISDGQPQATTVEAPSTASVSPFDGLVGVPIGSRVLITTPTQDAQGKVAALAIVLDIIAEVPPAKAS